EDQATEEDKKISRETDPGSRL
ncbi:uncharacterized protein METZ01_LOCUS455002, partial [marine metagenome]